MRETGECCLLSHVPVERKHPQNLVLPKLVQPFCRWTALGDRVSPVRYRHPRLDPVLARGLMLFARLCSFSGCLRPLGPKP